MQAYNIVYFTLTSLNGKIIVGECSNKQRQGEKYEQKNFGTCIVNSNDFWCNAFFCFCR